MIRYSWFRLSASSIIRYSGEITGAEMLVRTGSTPLVCRVSSVVSMAG